MPSPQSNQSYPETAASAKILYHKVRQTVDLQSTLYKIVCSVCCVPLCVDFWHIWQMYNSCTYNVYNVQVLKISFWHALLLQTWQEKQQAHSMLQRCVHPDVTSNVVTVQNTAPSSCGWSNWARPSRRSAGSSSCCCQGKLVHSVSSPMAIPAHPTIISPRA